MIVSLLYISRCALEPERAAEQVADILATARSRNAELQLTGALIWTEVCFAQILEGPEASVDEVMAGIARDPRHTDMRVLFKRPIAERRFSDWRMAYSGTATYVDRHLALLFGGFTKQTTAIEQLVTLMEEYSRMSQRRR